MTRLNYLCKHDVSDEDCYKCMKRGIIFGCPDNCPDFEDMRANMSASMLDARAKLMGMLGVKE